MILRKYKISSKDTRNELKSYHNKIEWLNFVLMQDSWQQLKSDSTSWQKILKNSHNSQIQWPVVSTLCKEMKNHLNQKDGFEGTLKLDPNWKSQPATYKGKYGVSKATDQSSSSWKSTSSQHWCDEKWKSNMAKGGGNKKRFQYCTDPSGKILYLRALQGHSGRNLIHPSLQDKVLIPDDFFEYIYHVGCATNLHSIINSGLIPGAQNLSKRQTVFFLPVNPMNKEQKDPKTVDLKAPRLAQNLQTAWKNHQSTVYWVDIRLAQKKGLKFYQTRSNAIILYNTPPSLLYPEGYQDGNWRNQKRKSIWVTSTASEDFLEK